MPFNYYNGDNALPRRIIDGVGFGKNAIITGCASGIGLATTQLFLSHQYSVLGVDVQEMDYSKIMRDDQERFHFHRADLSGEGECDEVVRICTAEYGEHVDVLANIAGIMDGFAAADSFADQDWLRIMTVNLTVPTKLIRAVLPFMRARKSGSIVNCSSKAGQSGAVAGVAYTASKHGLLGVTKHTAWRFKDEGIRCNAILPGGVDTNIAASTHKESYDLEGLASLQPVHDLHMVRGGKPDIAAMDCANAILFLSSEQAKWINGVSLPIDKAWSVV